MNDNKNNIVPYRNKLVELEGSSQGPNMGEIMTGFYEGNMRTAVTQAIQNLEFVQQSLMKDMPAKRDYVKLNEQIETIDGLLENLRENLNKTIQVIDASFEG